MISINNKKFAESENESLDSLFKGTSTCVGYAKRLKRQIKLFDHQKKLVGIINRFGVLCLATKQDNGKYWYSYGDIDIIGRYPSFEAEYLAVDSCNSKDGRQYWYKK